MGWVRLEDSFYTHPQVIDAGHQAAWLYVAGLCYSSQQLTDGRVPKSVVPFLSGMSKPKARAAALRLIDVGLWQDADRAYLAVDYAKHGRTRALVERQRRIAGVRAAVTPTVRLDVLRRDGAECQACGAVNDLEIDHIEPVSRGGQSDMDNLQVLCKPCNLRKGAD